MSEVASMATNVPGELIWEILLGLPVRRLLKFKTVSKAWCEIIGNSQFAKDHCKASVVKNRFNLLLTDDDDDDGVVNDHMVSISYEDYTEALVLNYPCKYSNVQIRVSGSCNGLVYLQLGKQFQELDILWNVATREYKQLAPKLAVKSISDASSIKTAVGYDETSDDYKVINVYQFTRDLVYQKSIVMIYTLSTDSWKLTTSPGFSLGSLYNNNIVTNGNPHWLATNDAQDDEPTSIVGFDLERDMFLRLPNPKGVSKITTAGFLGGSFSILVGHDNDLTVDVWIMKRYGVGDSWEKRWTIPCSCPYGLRYLMILFYHGDHIVFKNVGNEIVFYDPRLQRRTTLPLSGLPNDMGPDEFYFTIYVGTLVSLNSGTFVPSLEPAAANREERMDEGKQQDSPLLLLGQYSDEEAIEEPMEDISPKKPSAEQMAQVEFVARACGNMEDNMAESSAVQNIKEEELNKESTQFSAAKDLESNKIEKSGSLPLNDTQKVEESTTLASDSWHSGVQIAGEVAHVWKLVMHEQTNQYYYWNIKTGETSWEVPAIFAQGAEMGTEHKVPSVIEGSETIAPSNDASYTLHKDPVAYSSMAAGSLCNTNQVKYMNEGYTIGNVTYSELGVAIDHTELESTDVRTSLGFKGTNGRPLIANDHLEAEFIISSRLVSYAESLIQKLEELGRSDVQLQGKDWISKYILEIEIRLSDFKSLLTYGSSLLPFWMHSEEKLRGLEHAINDHISQLNKTGQTNEGDTISLYRDDSTSHQTIAGDSETKTRNQTAVPCTGNPQSPPKIDTSIILKEAEDTSNDVDDKHILPSASPSGYIGNVFEGDTQEVNEPVLPTGLILQPVPSVVEEEDMDVDMNADMESDDEITTSDQRFRDDLGAEGFPPPEHSSQHDLSVEHPPSMLEEEYDVPPPSGDDWIPPPLLDAEPVPPPPPDDPPAPTNGPEAPHSETILHFPYTEQYVYPVSGSEYCGSTVTEVPSLNYYAHSEIPQAVESQAEQYYSTTPTTYSETTPVIVNTMHPSVYHDLPKETVVPVPTKSCFESSGIYGEPDLVSYRDTNEETGNLGTVAKSECSSLPNAKDESVALVHTHESETATSKSPPLPTTVQTTAVTAPMPLTNTASGAVAPSTTAANAPTKVVRSKKRTTVVAPTLRSNKVSSLVDKWKAAKEELHEDEEDEPPNAYELLERKQQREIEQWRAHQIATGEAKDNAKFQPLGGDWRERVKRKRA